MIKRLSRPGHVSVVRLERKADVAVGQGCRVHNLPPSRSSGATGSFRVSKGVDVDDDMRFRNDPSQAPVISDVLRKALGPSEAVRPAQSTVRSTSACPALRSTAKSRAPLTPTVFHEPWWLEAATGGCYEEVTVSSGGRTVGRLPYLRRQRFGLSHCLLPELTHFLGPAVDEGTGGLVSRNLRRNKITLELIEKLPSFDFFYQRLHRDVADALPFVQHSFRAEASFTYEVEPASEAELWGKMRDKTRNVIRRAQEQSKIVELEPGSFCSLYENNLQNCGRSVNHMYSLYARPILGEAINRKQGRIIGAQEACGTISAAIFYVWDSAVTYYLLGTRKPDSGNGLVSLLIWEAMIDSARNGRVFDFDGVGSSGSVPFYISFGGTVKPRYTVYRKTPRYRLLDFSMTSWQMLTQKSPALSHY